MPKELTFTKTLIKKTIVRQIKIIDKYFGYDIALTFKYIVIDHGFFKVKNSLIFIDGNFMSLTLFL